MNFNKEKIFKYAIKKSTIGAISIVIGALIFGSPVQAYAQDSENYEKNITVAYTTLKELTEDEKKLIISQLDHDVVNENDTYYVVYRAEKNALPKTTVVGDGNHPEVLGLAGLGLILLAVRFGRNKKKLLSSIIVLSTLSTSLLLPQSVEALTSHTLKQYNKTYTLSVGDELPATKITIPGYEFVGYIVLDDILDEKTKETSTTVSTDDNKDLTDNKTDKNDDTVKPNPVITTNQRTETVEIPVTEENLTDSNMFVDEAPRRVEGSPGLVTVTYEDTLTDGVVTNSREVARRTTKEMVTTKIYTGTKQRPVTTTNDRTVIEAIPVTTQELTDSNLFVDETRSENGSAGEITVILRDTLVDGVVTDTQEVSRTITKAMVPNKVYRGTKQRPVTTTNDRTVIETIPVTTQELTDSNLFVDETRSENGSAGEITVILRDTLVDGVVTDTQEVSRTITKAMVPNKVYRGTKQRPVITTRQRTETVEIPIAEEKLTDSNMFVDEAPRRVEGSPGLVTVTYEDTLTDGTVTSSREVSRQTTREMVTTKIYTGTKQRPVITTRQRTETIEIPVTEENLTDSNIFFDDAPRRVEGTPGLITVTYEDTLTDGTVTSSREVSRQTTREMVTTKIYTGTKQRKTAPVLTRTSVTKNDLDKSVTITHQLTDRDNAFVSGEVKIYERGTNKLVATRQILPLQHTIADELSYDTPYEVETTYTYNIGNGNVSETLPQRTPFELELKKIEIKDVDNVALYLVDNNTSTQLDSLTDLPTNINNYFVKVQSDRFRDMLLPITNAVEEVIDGVTVYKFTANVPELVHDTDKTANSNYANQYVFYVAKASPVVTNVYTDFTQLINAMNANPSGTFILGNNMDASSYRLPDRARSYVTSDFTGTLIGNNAGNKYAISNLGISLFNVTRGATISDLDIKNVNMITEQDELAVLLRKGYSTKVSDVSVVANVKGHRGVSSLAYLAEDSTFNNISFKGSIESFGSTGVYSVGGVVGSLIRSSLTNVIADVDVKATGQNNDFRTGGVVGFMNGANSKMSNIVASGTVENKGISQKVGGVLGDTSHWNAANIGVLDNVVTSVAVTNGKLVKGDDLGRKASNIFVVDGLAKGDSQSFPIQTLTSEQAKEKQTSYNITATIEDSNQIYRLNLLETDYTSLNKATADRKIAYHNIEKLMPFYNKEQIVKYGNRVATDSNLYTKEIVSVTPVKNKKVVTDVFTNKTSIDAVMVLYKDNTLEYLPITYKEDFVNSDIAEYTITNTDLIYTPEQFLSSYDAIIGNVLPELNQVVYKSKAMTDALGVTFSETDITNKATASKVTPEEALQLLIDEKMDRLYLEEEFTKIKADLANYLKQVLATDASINTSNGAVQNYVTNYIKANKEKLLLGLTYMNRWYAINFGDTNIKDIASYHQDFFGKPIETMHFLVNLANAGYSVLQPYNNVSTYASNLAKNNDIAKLEDYLSKNREIFTDIKSDSEWFKQATTAYIVESKLEGREDFDVSVYSRLLSNNDEKRGLLPLLTSRVGIFIISNANSITYGMYDRYMNMKDPNTYPARKAEMESMIEKGAKFQKDHIDFWYRIANADVRDRLLRKNPMPIWDGYNTSRGWLPMYGTNANEAILDFFGPIERGRIANNGAGAYANGSAVFFVTDRILNQYGASVYTHEVVHNQDGTIYLGGFGRREHTGAEYYALGLLQSINDLNSSSIGLNTISVEPEKKDNTSRVHNYSVERFKNQEDLNTYVKRMFDLLYTFENAEAEVMLNRSDADKKRWYNQIVVQSSTGMPISVRQDMPENIQLNTIADLVNNDILSSRYGKGDGDNWGTGLKINNYWRIWMFDPVYAAANSPEGHPGDMMFRRLAYELFAYKGYNDGFIPYTSNKLQAASRAEGNARLTDNFIISKISDGQYTTMKQFKIAMLEENLRKSANLKPVTIRWNNRDITINSYAELKTLLDETITNDLARNQYNVGRLKQAIYNAYLRMTDDFVASIYNN